MSIALDSGIDYAVAKKIGMLPAPESKMTFICEYDHSGRSWYAARSALTFSLVIISPFLLMFRVGFGYGEYVTISVDVERVIPREHIELICHHKLNGLSAIAKKFCELYRKTS